MPVTLDPDAAAVLAQRGDQLCDGPETGRALGVAEDQAAAAGVHAVERKAGLSAEVNVVDGERVVRGDEVDRVNLQPGGLEGALCRRDGCFGHSCRVDP